mmetsp:Transcript_30109/g.36787  ORF Transcript_30109/g.36787 Transcript_30109/m.36787 type:complete len:268 (-) Transcript_30109:56-859(-)
MLRLYFTLLLSIHTTSNAFITPKVQSHHGHYQPQHLELSKVKTDVADEVDLCTIEGSYCDPATIELTPEQQTQGFSYGQFAREYPFVNNLAIASVKTTAADLLAQVVIAQTPVTDIDWQRSLLFCAFGAIYLGWFQYLYQVQVFKRLFDVDKFTSQTWGEKVRDGPGLRALGAQTALDIGVLTWVYLPTFYIFKAAVFGGSADPTSWAGMGLENYHANFAKDEFDLLRVWVPADLVCFSVPLYLRLPVRHVVSFVWTAYLSFARGGH